MAEDNIVVAPPPEEKVAEKPKNRQKRKDDFHIGNVIGQGAFGQVIDVEDKETGKRYAMKVLSKVHIVREKKMDYVKIERDVMSKLDHPNIVHLFLTFQDPGNLFYVIELAEGGDLQKVLNKHKSIDTKCSRIILGQLLLAIAHMHQRRILHRDLKPENVLLDGKNRVKLTDFGTSKIFDANQPFIAQRSSFVGSADFISPDILKENPVGPSSDLWSYGCIIYSMFTGFGPYHTESSYATFQKIEANEYTIPDYFPPEAKDLIEKLLQHNPENRLGHNEYDSNYISIRQHPFFDGIDWDALPSTSCPPFEPFLPSKLSQEANQSTIGNSSLNDEIVDNTAAIAEEMLPVSPMARYLLPGEKLLFEGDISKRVLLSVKERRLVLTDRPRLFYVDKKDNLVKGLIPICKDLKVKIISKNKWEIIVPGRTYNLSTNENNLEEWKRQIENVVSKLEV